MDNYKKTPTVYQMEATECGAASLAMIFAYFGKYMPLEQMRVEVGVSRDGCVAGNLMRAAKRFGLECHGYSKKLEFLKTAPTPSIIHWNFNHFVVFEGFKKGFAYINDPAVGRRKLTMEELDDGFTGIILTFAYTDKFVKEKAPHNLLSFMRSKLKNQYAVIVKLILIGVLLVFPGLVIPVLSQTFMDDVLTAGYTDWINKILIFMGACVLMKLGLNWYRNRLLSRFSSKMTILSGYGFLRHMLRLPMSFFDQRYAGDLVSRMDSNSEVSDFMSDELAKTALNLMVAVFYLAILIFYSPALAVIGIVNALICVTAVLISNKNIASSSVKIEMSQGKLFGTVCAGLNITDTIKASGAETEYSSRILGHQAKYVSEEQQLTRFQQVINAIPSGVNKLADVLILLVGGVLVVNGKMTMGMLVAFNSFYDSFCEPVNDLVGFSTKIQKLKASICRVEDIEKHPEDPGLVKAPGVVAGGKLKGEIELENISFGYSKIKPPLVEGLSFHLNTGESIAFVGASGCGKSTVAKLASGLYQPWSGRVLLDGREMSSIPNENIRGNISTVSQNIVIFSGSVRDNICLWNDAIPNDSMIQAAKDACIHDFIISQPDGYDYKLTEGASNLSGGQRQRLEIARALAVNPSILIMDEATSALDAITEKQILDNIRKRGCTCIIVAHRLSAIRDCNHIIVMKNGAVVQEGTHESLMKEIGYYRTLLMNS